MVEYACQLLSRLPDRPINILGLLSNKVSPNLVLEKYFTHPLHERPTQACKLSFDWDHLQVVSSVNTTIIRSALYLAWPSVAKGHQYWLGRDFVNAIMGLLKLAFQLSSESAQSCEDSGWIIVKAFLWTSWQRALMLHLWRALQAQLEGYEFDNNRSLAIRGIVSIPELTVYFNSLQLKDRNKTKYMCCWAYELLRNDRACVAVDLRRFHDCYANLFHDKPARCIDGPGQCDGASLKNCRRFKGATVLDQSAHDWQCSKDCKRLFWDRSSFLSVSGAKAICFRSTDDKYLRYRQASDKTLAISHVWSHGQGGRPDSTGFNSCLHNRYADLAKSFDCDSYWMDTPCIPSEKALRTACINNINKIFTESKVTLVCDQDIMNIDIGKLTMGLKESILSTMLVCDWNLRAWTLLEAMRGRQNVHLLCKRNKVLCFKKVLKSVHEEGRIDIATLFLTAQHLIPQSASDEDDWVLFPGGESIAPPETKMIEMGFVSVGEAGILLSHRHASRDGDDLVIWSLLINEKVFKDPAKMWESQMGSKIPTGYLLSSSPRIQGHSNLSWAPSCPTLRLPSDAGKTNQKFYLPFDGTDTRRGVITPEGLLARWDMYRFSSPPTDQNTPLGAILEISDEYLQNYHFGALLLPLPSQGPRTIPVRYRGNAEGHLLAVCGSNDERCWTWAGVYEWSASDALPEMKMEDVLLV